MNGMNEFQFKRIQRHIKWQQFEKRCDKKRKLLNTWNIGWTENNIYYSPLVEENRLLMYKKYTTKSGYKTSTYIGSKRLRPDFEEIT